jgi:hypothetical protein
MSQRTQIQLGPVKNLRFEQLFPAMAAMAAMVV